MSFFKIKPIWKGNSKHKKLSDDLPTQKSSKEGKEVIIEPENDALELENDVVTFQLKYLGSTVVEKSTDASVISSEAVKNIIKTAKAQRKQQKKLQRVNIAISTKGIAVTDLQGNDIFKVSIYRISNCSTDSTHRQVFSFISTDQKETMECHAFFSSKRKIAENVAISVGKVFKYAYDEWKELPPNVTNPSELSKIHKTREFSESSSSSTSDKENDINLNGAKSDGNNLVTNRVVSEEKLIDFDSEGVEDDDWEFDELMTRNVSNSSQWVSFDDEFPRQNLRVPPQNNLMILV